MCCYLVVDLVLLLLVWVTGWYGFGLFVFWVGSVLRLRHRVFWWLVVIVVAGLGVVSM